MVLGKLESPKQQNESRLLLAPCAKINSKNIKDLNIRPETMKYIGENISMKLTDLGRG